jgi:hypothetical protein
MNASFAELSRTRAINMLRRSVTMLPSHSDLRSCKHSFTGDIR